MARILSLAAALLLSSVMTASGAEPKPGKSDTFELDRYLRRNAHPLTVKLIARDAQATTNVPVTMGIGCGEGDYPAGKLCPVLDGEGLPAQVDVMATWPADGSIKQALVSVIVPEIPADETPVLTFRRALRMDSGRAGRPSRRVRRSVRERRYSPPGPANYLSVPGS